MEAWVPGLITGGFAIVVAILSGVTTNVLQARREARAREHASGAPGAPTVQQVWERQDTMERAFKAALVLLGESIEQHAEPAKLKLSKAAIHTLRESGYMPAELEDVLTENESN